MTQPALYQTDLKGLKLASRGKVRDIYDLGEHLLIVATDRISAFDVIMPNPIPGKGEVLTKLSEFWFRQMSDIVGNHLVTTDVEKYPEACSPHRDVLRDLDEHADRVRDYVDSVPNLVSYGRQGYYQYIHMHHAIAKGFQAADHILTGSDRRVIQRVGSAEQYLG